MSLNGASVPRYTRAKSSYRGSGFGACTEAATVEHACARVHDRKAIGNPNVHTPTLARLKREEWRHGCGPFDRGGPLPREEAQEKPWLSMDTFYPRETKHLGWFVNDCKHLQSHMACSRPCAVTLASILNLPPRNPFLPPLPPCPPAESEEAGSARTLRSGDERHVESGEDESAHSPRSWKSDSDADASSASFGSAHSPSEWSGSECGSCGSSGSAPSSVDEARYTYEAWCSQLEAVMLALTATLARARAGRCSGDDVDSMLSIQASWVRRLMKTKPPEWERRVRRLSWLRMEIEDACGRGPW